MRVIIRQTLIEHLLALPALMDLYSAKDPAFVDKSLAWFNQTENVLSKFRLPLASMVATQRGLILAVKDGYRDPELSNQEPSARKAIRATTALGLNQVEQAIRQELETINQHLIPLQQKMAQLISVSSASKPVPLPPENPEQREKWLRSVWENLEITDEMKAMYLYLNSTLAKVDLLYLLDELLNNLLSYARLQQKDVRPNGGTS